ncbi:hypothetical protein M8I34_04935 [Streptomyces sp. MCA2]|uniref:hypothetical protein n=1 Tax=Streptomyces sp. MCA2 TaxID=2944805 RepID=UPI0020225063|nr:hypothetical protein [Streptomyces sp. MCA2]MCL7490796.1 hypothetical protein [Streptomyces sp. MCA2]
MSAVELTAAEAARCALRAGLPLAGERHADVAATANHIHAVISTLRDLDFGETLPAAQAAQAAQAAHPVRAAHVVEREVADASL